MIAAERPVARELVVSKLATPNALVRAGCSTTLKASVIPTLRIQHTHRCSQHCILAMKSADDVFVRFVQFVQACGVLLCR